VELYPNAGEELTKDIPPEKGTRVRMTHYVDADYAHVLVVRRSIVEIILTLNSSLLSGYLSFRRQ
jgi:hypothetical protein